MLDDPQASRGLWRNRAFTLVWFSTLASTFGSSISSVALPLTAAVTLQATAGEMGLLRAVVGLPFLLFALHAGVLVDRMPRRRLLVISDLATAIALASIPVMAGFDRLSLTLLLGAAFLVGSFVVVAELAHGALLPSVCHRGRLVEANTKLEIARSLAQVGGPSLAGGLIQIVSAPIVLLATAVGHGASAGLVSRIEIRNEPHPDGPPQRIIAAIGEGLRTVWTSKLLRAIAIGQGLFGFHTSMIEAVYVLYILRDIGMSPGQYGMILAIGSVGSLVGAAVSSRLVEMFGLGRVMSGAAILTGIVSFTVPLALWLPFQLAVAILCIRHVVGGIALVVYMVNQISIRQSISPDRLQGRVSSAMRLISRSSVPLGALAGGYLGAVVGLQAALAIAACGMALGAVWVVASPIRQLHSTAGEAGM